MAWVVGWGAVLVVALLCCRCGFSPAVADLWRWYRHQHQHDLFKASNFTKLLKAMVALCSVLTVVFVSIFMSAYLLFKLESSQYSTHSEQYLWVSTAAYLHGVVPLFVVLFAFFCGLVGVCWLRRGFTQASASSLPLPLPSKEKKSLAWPHRVVLVTMHLLHASAVLAVNAAYVLAVLGGLSPSSLVLVQLAMAAFKTLWSSVVIPRTVHGLYFLEKSDKQTHRAAMGMLSFVGAPLITTFFSNTVCFQNVLVPQAATISTFLEPLLYSLTSCVGVTDNCTVSYGFDLNNQPSVTVTTTVVAGWLYSYQCSSALLVTFVPVLVLTYLLSGLLVPVWSVLCLHMPTAFTQRLFFVSSYLSSSSSSSSSNAAPTLQLYSHKELFVVDSAHVAVCDEIPVSNNTHFRVPDTKQETATLPSIDVGAGVSVGVGVIRDSAGDPLVQEAHRHPLFDSSNILCKLLLNLTVILTFWLASPLLCVAVMMDGLCQCLFPLAAAAGSFLDAM